jgi:hypothetical protein
MVKFCIRVTATTLKSGEPILYVWYRYQVTFLILKFVTFLGTIFKKQNVLAYLSSGLNYSTVKSDNLTNFFRENVPLRTAFV